jgi:hypothetical protein
MLAQNDRKRLVMDAAIYRATMTRLGEKSSAQRTEEIHLEMVRHGAADKSRPIEFHHSPDEPPFTAEEREWMDVIASRLIRQNF